MENDYQFIEGYVPENRMSNPVSSHKFHELGTNDPAVVYDFTIERLKNGQANGIVGTFTAKTWREANGKFKKWLSDAKPKFSVKLSGKFYPCGYGEAIYNYKKGRRI